MSEGEHYNTCPASLPNLRVCDTSTELSSLQRARRRLGNPALCSSIKRKPSSSGTAVDSWYTATEQVAE